MGRDPARRRREGGVGVPAVLAANPRDVRALTGAGIAAHILGREDQAVSSFKKALQLDPENVQALYLLGPIAYSQGDLDLAIKSWDRVVKIAPGNRAIYQQLEEWKKEAALHGTFAARQGARFTVMFRGAGAAGRSPRGCRPCWRPPTRGSARR